MKITEEDLEFLEEIIELDGTELGEYFSVLERLYNGGNMNYQMSEEFKAAIKKELETHLAWAKENIEIEEYTVTPQPSKRRRIKEV